MVQTNQSRCWLAAVVCGTLTVFISAGLSQNKSLSFKSQLEPWRDLVGRFSHSIQSQRSLAALRRSCFMSKAFSPVFSFLDQKPSERCLLWTWHWYSYLLLQIGTLELIHAIKLVVQQLRVYLKLNWIKDVYRIKNKTRLFYKTMQIYDWICCALLSNIIHINSNYELDFHRLLPNTFS